MEAECKSTVETAISTLGGLDIIISNAVHPPSLSTLSYSEPFRAILVSPPSPTSLPPQSPTGIPASPSM